MTGTAADDSFSGERVAPSEKGTWPQGVLQSQECAMESSNPPGAMVSSESQVPVKAGRMEEDRGRSTVKTADDTGSSGSE